MTRVKKFFAVLVFTARAVAMEPCRIEVVDKENGWPVPLVKLTTTGNVQFVTDNAGVAAFDLAEMMGKETWLGVSSHGYEVPADGFGIRGVKFTPRPGGKLRIEVTRTQVAKRLGRLTGSGIFAEAQRFGEFADWKETGVFGSDTVQTAVWKGKLSWFWGDTNLQGYPLGIFDTPGATTALSPLPSAKPPVGIVYDYFRDGKGAPRAVAAMSGKGPTWISALAVVPDKAGKEHLVASYVKIEGFLDPYEAGLIEWDDEAGKFVHVRTVWKRAGDEKLPPKPWPEGHAVTAKDEEGKAWLYFNGPPDMKCPATYEAWSDPAAWTKVASSRKLRTVEGKEIEVAYASLAWSGHRQRWVMIVQQKFGEPSAFGEVWYVEGKTPEGPWGPAVKIATHENYTFYNIQIDHWLTPPQEPVLLFEGTYTTLFADRAEKTPRWDYNQVLYRLDLDDPALKAAQER